MSDLKKKTICLPKSYADRLDDKADSEDLNVSELIRRWIDDNIPKELEKPERFIE